MRKEDCMNRRDGEGGRVPGLDEEKLAREADAINRRFAQRTGETFPASLKRWKN